MKRIFQISVSLGVLLLPLITLWSQGYVFGPNIRVSDYPPGSATCWLPSSGMRGVDVKGDTVYCVWQDTRTGNRGVWFAKSTDDGQTFLPNVQVNDGLPNAYTPTIAVGDDGTIYVAWIDERPGYSNWQIYFSKSTDDGLTFTPDVLVNDTAGILKNRNHTRPSMAVDSAGTIYIAFLDGRNATIGRYDIYFSKSTDGGATFIPDILVNDTLPGDSMWTVGPSLALSDDNTLYISWSNWYRWIYVSKSTDGGVSFSTDVLVNDTITESWQNSMDVDSRGYVHVIFRDRRDNNHNIYYSRSTDGGLSFSPNIRVNDPFNEPVYQGAPSMCVDDSGMVYVVWQEGSAVQPDIYFTLSTDIGDSAFVEPDVKVSDVPPDSEMYNPSIAVGDSGKVYVIWRDSRLHDWIFDVFFAVGKYESGVEESKEKMLTSSSILSVYPSPFYNKVSIRCLTGKEAGRIEIKVIDISGRIVRSKIKEYKTPGLHVLEWNGRNDEGEVLPSGAYFINAKIENHEFSQKVVLIRR